MKLLKKLSEALGPSGHESNVREIIRNEIKEYVDEISVDKFGNLIARIKGNGSKVMLAAHMDEIGLLATNIDKNGHINFQEVGGIEPITLIGQTVEIMSSKGDVILNGVITFSNLQDDLLIEEVPDISELYIDTGLSKKQLVAKGVGVGTYIMPKHSFKTLGSEKIVSGKALDDRIGCYILINVIKKIKKSTADIYFVFTVQEEIGLNGAKTSVYHINPDWGIAVDTTNTEDSDDPKITIGKGPCITIMDAEMISNRCVNAWIMNICRKSKYNVQPKVESGGTTDATKIMLAKGGIPSTALNCPVRNIHSTISVAHMDDVNVMIDILRKLLKDPPKKCIV